jgi:hypothetical protein
MDNDSGKAGRLHEPPKLATVRRLHIEDAGESGPSQEWYETERLTGHITGGASPTSTSCPPAPAQDALVLDWRHPASSPPSLFERFGRNLIARRYRPRRRFVNAAAHARVARAPGRAVRGDAAGQGAEQAQGLAAEISGEQPSAPRIGFRHGVEQPVRQSSWCALLPTSHRDTRNHPRPRRNMIVGAVTLGAISVLVVGITSQLTTTRARPPQAQLDAAISTPIAGPSSMATVVIGAVRALERKVPNVQAPKRAVAVQRRVRHETRQRRPARSHQTHSSSGSTPIVASTSKSSAGSGRTVGASSYRSSSSSPTYSSQHSYSSSSSSATYTAQPQSRESAPPASTTSTSHPAGPSGLGSQVGNNCNPKCG